MSNYALMLKSTNGFHITVGYYQKVTAAEIKAIKQAWNDRVNAKVVGVKTAYQSDGKNENDFRLVKPSPYKGTEQSAIVVGRLQKLIERFRANEGAFLESKRSQRMNTVHVQIGATNVANLKPKQQFLIGSVKLTV